MKASKRSTQKRAVEEKAPQAPSLKEVAAKAAAAREKARARALGLVARAAHETTPEEEARTSALYAAKIIHKEKLLAPPRHALVERLDALDDEVLNELAVLVEEALAAGSVARAVSQTVRWRNEAKHLQLKLDALGGSLQWILQGYKLGLAERVGMCGLCPLPLRRGEIIVWKRRRFDAVHYTCCVAALQQQGGIPW